MAQEQTSRSVTQRLLSVLAALDIEHPKRTLSEIAQHCDLPVSTTHRLVADLVDQGLLERDEQGRYSGGLRLWELGCAASRPAALRDAAMPFMQDLYEATHENVHLGVLVGYEVLYLAKLHGRASFPIVTVPGARVPWSPSGIGKVIAAFRPDVVEDLLAGPLPRLTPRTITEPDQLRAELDTARACGHAFNIEEMTPNTYSVAAPIFDWQHHPIAAISVTSHTSKAGLPRLVPAVQAVAAGISRNLPVDLRGIAEAPRTS